MDPMISPEMKQKYYARRSNDFEILQHSFQSNDFETIANIAHQIKGNAPTFGFDELRTIAVMMERAAQLRMSGELSSCLESYRAWLATNRLAH